MIEFLHLLISVVVLAIILNGDCVTSILTDGGSTCYGGPNSSIRSDIQYPFYSEYTNTDDYSVLSDHQLLNTTYVGYPGFLVNCEDDGRLTSNLSTTNLYSIQDIDYSGRTFTCIRYPFYSEYTNTDAYPVLLRNHSLLNTTYVGYPGFLVNCEDDGRLTSNLSTTNLYYLQDMDYSSGTFTAVDVSVDGQECPQPQSQPQYNFSAGGDNFYSFDYNDYSDVWMFYNCSSGYPEDTVQHLPCLDDSYNNKMKMNTTSRGGRSFAFLEEKIPRGYNWYQNCKEIVRVPVRNYLINESDYGQALRAGFQLYFWANTEECSNCRYSGDEVGYCVHSKQTNAFVGCICRNGTKFGKNGVCWKDGISTVLKIIYGTFSGLGGILIILYVIHRMRVFSSILRCKNKFKSPTNVETFLENCGNLAVERYTYSSIKRMTNSFKDPLGQGGYGSVFKGMLNDGRLVAVKVLNESKGKGEDFINEVATISKTNHVNVVNLLGFCSDGMKRALVYEFMSNGSLERFIYGDKTSNTQLGSKILYEVALGIARGLEYLHYRCNTRIVHFDIKPHNILLDKDFCPKISDFGLAKLCPTRASIVSMIGARGTRGYIAPEVCCTNFGGVSHKSDVYSYGMMMLEMIGGRKNIDITVENTSEIYFPQWIYNHLKQNKEVEVVSEIFQEETTRKMIIISLWCIQMQSVVRPSISQVVEMLEGNIEFLQMPPNPFQNDSVEASLESSVKFIHH